jgi:perosamine synthetase
MSGIVPEVVERIRGVVGPGSVALHEPFFGSLEKKAVVECLESTWVSTAGPWVSRFEDELALVTASAHVVAVSTGTAALQLALRLVGVKPGDEVLVPALSFVATANAVAYVGAIPHFVDIDEETIGLDAEALGVYLRDLAVLKGDAATNRLTGRKISAIVPMHCFGQPTDIIGLQRISEEFSIPIVEDAAEALGSTLDGRHCGVFGEVGTLSFNGNKIVTTGGGGAILTSNPELAEKARHLSTTARIPHRWEFEHDEIGYNYRLPNLNAALGWAQLQHLEETIGRKRNLSSRYQEAFQDLPGVAIVSERPGVRSNYWLNTLLLSGHNSKFRNELLDFANDQGLGVRPAWKLLSALRPYAKSPRSSLAVSETLQPRIINLPSSAFLADSK